MVSIKFHAQLKGVVALAVIILCFLCHFTEAHDFRHGKHHVHHKRHETSTSVSMHVPSASPLALTAAERMIKEVQAALGIMNKGKLEYPNGNSYTFAPNSATKSFQKAKALDYQNSHTEETGKTSGALNITKRDSGNSIKYSYTISPELAEAAKIVAESSPLPLPGDYGVDIASVTAKYRGPASNDTNMPAQKYVTSNGLDKLGPARISEHEVQKNELKKRGSSDFWLSTMEQTGTSPFAPEGYKVWRNVKEYGAKGDGVTDDTAAINKAIADGGRCGADCGSSTIYPAFVYFPPGTYLVSSPIIQYYNTEFYGNPIDYPTILAASSFVGLGVITSDVYTGDTTEWYLNTNNFLRSIRNFKMDITRTDPNAYVCAIHWQVAQATSLENIIFYMIQDGMTTQQGVYLENGSGGFLSNLTFVGGNFGAYFGNQQFTTTQLIFMNCKTALQIHWDWAWTMQGVVISNCTSGIVIVGGAGGAASTGQSVGSLIVLDTIIASTQKGVVTSLFAENSTSFLLQNTAFIDVDTAVLDSVNDKTLLAGGASVNVESWGFGRVATTSTNSEFVNGENIPAMDRSGSLTAQGPVIPSFFQRRRPTYADVGMSQVINVKAWGAVGDGKTDDSVILNSILDRAANMSAIVFFPFGVYVVKDTLRVPVGSRIVGQAWSQIVATGANFEDEMNPRTMVQVGRAGDVGIVEIQSMMFTVSGPTAGAVLLEWNVHESTQGSSGMWDSHFRVGGNIGSSLQVADCPAQSGSVNEKCKAASLLLHLTPQSSAYLENVWVWTADHDLDAPGQDQIDVYTGRGVLIESQGPTWLYGTASEHSVLYQYQISGAKDLFLGMIQTEAPYFQPIPAAPSPFSPGLFPNDPNFDDCILHSVLCPVAWAVRIMDSVSVYSMGSGLYTWFSKYSQDCLDSDECQQRAFEISESTDTWLYNVVTKGIFEMVSPNGEPGTLAGDNVNGFMSSILAWIREGNKTIGQREFAGFQLYQPEWLTNVSDTCSTALTQKILCASYLQTFDNPTMGQFFDNTTLTDILCDSTCGSSLKNYFDNVSKNCAGQMLGTSVPTKRGGYIYAGYNSTCLKDKSSGEYCTQVTNDFADADSVADMSDSEACSYCFTTDLQMRQASPFAPYTEQDKETLEAVQSRCGLSGPTSLHDSLWVTEEEDPAMCVSDITYETQKGDTCDTLAMKFQVSSAAIQIGNPTLINNCTGLIAGRELCIPLSCETQYKLQDNDTCTSIEWDHNISFGDVRRYNPWIKYGCTNLLTTREIQGSIICLSPQAGIHNSTGGGSTGSVAPGESTGYTNVVTYASDDMVVANGTTDLCGKWYTVQSGDTCAQICVQQEIASSLFLEVNPSLKSDGCDASLVTGTTYCVGPDLYWDDPSFWEDD